MDSQRDKQTETGKPAFVTPSKPNVDERNVQLTIEEAIERSSSFEVVRNNDKVTSSNDSKDGDTNINPNVVINFNINSATNSNVSNNSKTILCSNGQSDFNETLSKYIKCRPIIGRMYNLIFNYDFRFLYEFAMSINDIYPDLIEFETVADMPLISNSKTKCSSGHSEKQIGTFCSF